LRTYGHDPYPGGRATSADGGNTLSVNYRHLELTAAARPGSGAGTNYRSATCACSTNLRRLQVLDKGDAVIAFSI
jgi:hypothetical protein